MIWTILSGCGIGLWVYGRYVNQQFPDRYYHGVPLEIVYMMIITVVAVLPGVLLALFLYPSVLAKSVDKKPEYATAYDAQRDISWF